MNILILGGCGFIGSHLGKRFTTEGHRVHVVDIKENEYMDRDEFCSRKTICDLRNPDFVDDLIKYTTYDEVYQLAADMGGSGYIFTGEHDADVMHNSSIINLNVAKTAVRYKRVGRVFYSSSACAYSAYNQTDPNNPKCTEDSIYPAFPDSEYGWEKIFSERMYKAFERNYGLKVRIARFHNIFGPQSCYNNGREKAPAALCRKVAEVGKATAKDKTKPYIVSPGEVDIWGDGFQTRSFLYVDECIEGIIKLMRSNCKEILNIGSDEMISINNLAKMIIRISGKNLSINNIDGPQGVRGRNSDNTLIKKELDWAPTASLEEGITKLYHWVNKQVNG